MRRIGPLLAALCLLSAAAHAEIKFAAWNVDGVQKTPEALKANAVDMQSDIGAIDVLIVEEVISAEQVAAIAEGLGLENWAISDFSPPVSITKEGHRSLEVGIISRFPIEAVAEWDTTGRKAFGDGFAPRTSDESIVGTELPIEVPFGPHKPSRGFLRADLAGGWTILVAGDYNIQAPGNVPRSGTDPLADCAPTGSCDGICGAGGSDGYDDSIHTLLTLGNGATLLTRDVDFTYVNSPFPGGAIDHMLVAGPRADSFSVAATPNVSGNRYRGSDHRPVFATSSAQPDEDTETDRERLDRLILEVRRRLMEIERILRDADI